MSTSMLNHTFGIPGVQYISVNFLAVRPLLTAACTATISSARTANLVMLLSSAKLQELSKCCQWAIEKPNSLSIFRGLNAKTAVQ